MLIPVAAVSLRLVGMQDLNKETRVLPGAGTYQPGTGTYRPGTGTYRPGAGTDWPGTGKERCVKGQKAGKWEEAWVVWVDREGIPPERMALTSKNGRVPGRRSVLDAAKQLCSVGS